MSWKSMTPKMDMVLEQCIDAGLRMGYRRAFKHSDNPDEETIFHRQHDCVMEEIYQWFDIENNNAE